jgi:hypothetical protein
LHEDVDVYIEYPAEIAKRMGCHGLGDLNFMRIETGKKSGEKFDVRESNVPFERSSLGDEYNQVEKPKKILFGAKQRRAFWE